MKKTFVTASIISAALFLSACGETTETPVDSSAEETTAPAETEQTIEETNNRACRNRANNRGNYHRAS